MATTLNDKVSKQPLDTKTELEATLDEPPPTYSPPTSSVANKNDGYPRPIPSKIKPTNFLLLANDRASASGEFVIDPSLHIPSSMLSPPDKGHTEEDHKNLCLRSTHGSVRAEIWLLAHRGTEKPRRTSIMLSSSHGYVYSYLHAVDATPFVLNATAMHGSVTLGIPRSFTGLLLLSTTYGKVWLSEAMKAHVTQLSQLGDKRQYFVGDLGSLEDVWEGSQVEAEAVHGWVTVRYDDEGTGKKGLFNTKEEAVDKLVEQENGDKGQGKKRFLDRLFRS